MFKVSDGKGFQMTFSNGWTVSVQWGVGNYCAVNHRWTPYESVEIVDRTVGAEGSATAEIAAWDANNVWYQFPADTVKGYCTPDEVADFIKMISAM